MDEPESTAALALAAREGLDNLTFVINCNLQRLDGPVRANFKIVQELEAQFRGAGWNVIKTLWGTAWDELFQLDTTGALVRRLREVPDAQFQTYATRDVAYIRAHFFGDDPALAEMAKLLSDDKIARVFPPSRGGHEARKVYAAYKAARRAQGRADRDPGPDGQGLHAGRGLRVEERQPPDEEADGATSSSGMRDLLELPIPTAQFVDGAGPLRPPGRRLPRGPLPPGAPRRPRRPGPGPPDARRSRPARARRRRAFTAFDKGSGTQKIATTMAFVRLVKDLIRDKETGRRWVPIVPDEARTFGMESLFPSARHLLAARARRTSRSTATS